MTNFECIKAMSVEELAPLLIQYREDWDDFETHNEIYDEYDEALKAEIQWLESEVEE